MDRSISPPTNEVDANSWVNRTPSGLPLCSTCHKELGFCSHSPMIRRNPEGPFAAVPPGTVAGAGIGTPAPDMNTPSQPLERTEVEDSLQQGTKRRLSAVPGGVAGKGKRRETSLQPKSGKSAPTARDHQGNTGGRRNPRRSTRPLEVGGNLEGRRRKIASSFVRDNRDDNSSIPQLENPLLRFTGFEENKDRKECISCYQVEDITVNFGCEARREKEAARARAGEGGAPMAVGGWSEVDVPHVMCVGCFRIFVESRVSDRKLVTSHDFDGYTVGCPMGCANSFVDPSCFEGVMGAEFMVKYRRFAAIHLASHMRIVWCPGCHCGVVPSAAIAAARRSSVVEPLPDAGAGGQQEPFSRGPRGYLWRLFGGPEAAEGQGEDARREPHLEIGAARARPSLCIGCPGCQASLCMSCRQLHAPGVTCTAAAAAAAAAAATAAGDGVGGGSTTGGLRESAPRASTGSREEGREEGRGQLPHENDSATTANTVTTKRCPSCHVPIFKDGGCNHMKCSMCQYEFCWLHLTEWIIGGDCQRGHWSNNPALNRAYNAQRVARERRACTIS